MIDHIFISLAIEMEEVLAMNIYCKRHSTKGSKMAAEAYNRFQDIGESSRK